MKKKKVKSFGSKKKLYNNSKSNKPISNDIRKNSIADFVTYLGADLSSTSNLSHNNRFHTITLNRALLSETYLEHGIVQVLIDQPIDDAFRGGIDIKCPEISSDEINEMYGYIERNEIISKYSQALKWSRLYGGAGVIINCGQDMTKEFIIASITEKTPLDFYAADRWELSYFPQGNSILDKFKEDEILDCPYNYYGHRMHKSRVIKLNNKEAPSLIRGQFGGWGVSELEKIIRSYNQYTKHQNVTYELMDESKIDVLKIQGFNSQMMTDEGSFQTAKRISEAAKIKNYQNALVIDKDDDFEQKTMAFGGLAEILTQIRIGLACDLRMPMTKLFGLSASGFSAGEEDIENYNSMIESDIRTKVKTGMIDILKIVSQKVLGYIPDNITFDFKPLRVMSSKEESNIKTETLNRVLSLVNSGLVTSEKAIELINNEKIFFGDLEPSEALTLEEMKELGITKIEPEKEVNIY